MRLSSHVFLAITVVFISLISSKAAVASELNIELNNTENKKQNCKVFERTEWISDHLAYVSKGDIEGFVNAACQPTIPIQSYYLKRFSEGMAVIGADNFGYINEQGKIAIPFQYQKAASFSEGLALVSIKNRDDKHHYAYIDKSGNPVITLPKDILARSFSERMAAVVNDQQKFGFISDSGKLVIPYSYDYAANFYEGVALVSQNDSEGKRKQFFINKNGEKVLDVSQYDMVGRFYKGLVAVSKDQHCGFINQQGNLVIPIEHDCLFSIQLGAAIIDLDRQIEPFISLNDMVYKDGEIKKHSPYPEFFAE